VPTGPLWVSTVTAATLLGLPEAGELAPALEVEEDVPQAASRRAGTATATPSRAAVRVLAGRVVMAAHLLREPAPRVGAGSSLWVQSTHDVRRSPGSLRSPKARLRPAPAGRRAAPRPGRHLAGRPHRHRVPAADGAAAWYDSEAYQAIIPLRADNADGWIALFDGVVQPHRGLDVLQDAHA